MAKIVQCMLLFSRLKEDPFTDLNKDEDQLETNEVAKDEESKNEVSYLATSYPTELSPPHVCWSA